MGIDFDTEIKTKKIAFLGGDMRILAAARSLLREGCDILIWGAPTEGQVEIKTASSLREATEGAFAVVLPLPASTDGVNLRCADMAPEAKVSMFDVADAVEKGSIILGGKLPDAFCSYAESCGIRVFDYFRSEALQIKNAYTTAEAAVNIAMGHLQKNIKDSRFAVTGYGRISKQLTLLLRSFGAHVTVAARKASDLAGAALMGADTVKLEGGRESIKALCKGYDVVFNTVPAWLFDGEVLKAFDKNTLLIDLASAPGGVDIAEAKRQRKNVLWATSLPGKYAPESAGRHIAEAIKEILYQEVAK